MEDPFRLLGCKQDATPEEIRHAYHLLARKCHPDKCRDEEQEKQAQQRMTMLNLAYQEALRLVNLRSSAPYAKEVPCDEAIRLSAKMLSQGYAAGALRELLRAEQRSPLWYHQQGLVLMAMEQYETALQSFREAVRREPSNNEFRRGALSAEMALRESRTLKGRVRKFLHLQKK